MTEVLESLFSNNVVALGVASVIFLVTITLVAKRIIGFLLTLVFLFFAITSGFTIANNDIVRDYIQGRTHETIVERTEEKLNGFFVQFMKALDDLRDEILGEKEKQKNKHTDNK